jgi:hypothetical protein
MIVYNIGHCQDFIGCYDAGNDEELVFGEHFHIGRLHPSKESYDFITGGGGMVLSRDQCHKTFLRCKE